jgi:hypothetical protein
LKSFENDGDSDRVAPDKPTMTKPEPPQHPTGLVSEVNTRWNSLIACVCSVIGNSEALTLLWEQGKGDAEPMFSEDEWQELEDLAAFLVRFKVIH